MSEPKANAALGLPATISEETATPAKEPKNKRIAKGLQDVDESKLLHGAQLYLTFACMLLSLLLIAIDQTILGPALPVITSQFNALRQSAWVISAFIMTQACFLLAFGQLMNLLDRKLIYLGSIGIFELGSLLCAVAPNVEVLILGRAVAGVGAAGIMVSMIALISLISKLEDRPLLMGLFGAVFGISSVIGPLLGGAFTQHVSWRWVFYINLPIGGLSFTANFFQLSRFPPPPLSDAEKATANHRCRIVTGGRVVPKDGGALQKFFVFDIVGTLLLLGAIVLLLLALIWGGLQYKWSSGTIIGLLVACAVLFLAFLAYEKFGAGACPLLPLRFYRNKTIIGCSIIGFCMFFGMFIISYFLTEYFEAVHHDSPTSAGIKILPFMGTFIVSATLGGVVIKKSGRYWPLMVVFPAFLSIGAGLLYTLDENSSYAKNAGFQVLFGLGVGPVFQNVFLAVQANVLPREIPQATAAVSLWQRLGGAVGTAICSAVLNSSLKTNLRELAPTANYTELSQAVAAIYNTSITPLDIRANVIKAFARSLRDTFIAAAPLGAISILAALLLVKNVSILSQKPGKDSEKDIEGKADLSPSTTIATDSAVPKNANLEKDVEH